MKKFKTFFSMLLCLLLALVMPLAACSGGSSDSGNSDVPAGFALVDFENQTETVGLGENYVLPNGVAFDKDGNDYRVTYEVKDSAGEKVSVLNGRFKIKEMGEAKYVITCYAEVGEEKYLSRTITLNVVDRAAPNITIEPLAFAFVNTPYTISGVEVSDNTGETVEPVYEVTKKADDSAVTVTDGKFTPDTKGEYTLKVTATDASGNVGTNSAPIYVREPMGAYVIENFNDEYGLPVFSVKEALLTEKDVVYHETFDPTPEDTDNGDERVGVAEGTSVLASSATYGAHYYFKFNSDFKNIGNFEYIYIKAYIHSAIADQRPQVELYTQNEPLGDDNGVVNVNEWIEIRLTAEDICSPDSTFADPNELRDGETPLDCFKRKMTSGSGYYLFWIPNREYGEGDAKTKDSASNYTLYVDEIGYKPLFNPTVDVEESYDLGETITLEPTVITDEAEADYDIEVLVTDPSGNPVTLTDGNFRLTETGDYTVELRYVSNKYNGYTKYTITAISTKEIEVGAYTGTPVQGDTITFPAATIDGGTVTASVKLEGQNIAMTGDLSFKANVAGDYVVTYAATIDGLVYKKDLTIGVSRAPIAANEVISFSSKAEMTDNIALESITATWLPAFEGADGVVKLNSTASWSYFAFKQLQGMTAYEGYKYVVLRMYLPAESTTNGTFWLGESTGCAFGARDTWVEYALSGDVFRTIWNEEGFNVWNKMINFRLGGDLYIDGVYMMNDVSDTGLTATVTNLTTAGAELRDGDVFSVTLPANAPAGATLTVKAPDGTTVSDLSGITAQFGEYTVEITCDGYLGKITSKITVFATYNFEFTSEPSVSGTNVTLKTYKVSVGNDDVTNNADVAITVTLNGYTQAIAVTDNAFTAPFTGATYKVLYAVTYNAKTYNYEYSVDVASAHTATDSEVIAFAEPTHLTNTETYDSTIEWVASYQGKTGVAKFTAQKWGYFGFKPLQAMSAYAGCGYLVISMYIETAGYSGSLWLGGENNCITAVKSGAWVDYYFPGDVFTTKWANNATAYSIWSMAMSVSEAATMYVDEVRVESAITPITGNGVLTFAEKAQMMNTETYDSTIEWVASYQGKTGVAKFTAKKWGYFGFKPLQAMSAYENCNYLVIRMYIETANYNGTLWFGGVEGKCHTTVKSGEWVDYYFDGAIFKTNWANSATAYSIWSMAMSVSEAATMYVDEIFVATELPA